MKKVTVNWDELSEAFGNSGMELRYFLDTDTGQVLMVTAEDQRYLQELYEEAQEEEASAAFDLELALAKTDLPEWQQEGVRTADFIEIHFGGRIIAIPEADTRAGYDAMQAFIATVENRRLQNQLFQATHGRGAFRRFRDILGQHLMEEQRWYAFEENRLRQQIAAWLAEEGIEPINDPGRDAAVG